MKTVGEVKMPAIGATDPRTLLPLLPWIFSDRAGSLWAVVCRATMERS